MFDDTVRPQDDFFGYVNNNWIKANPIPPSESTWGTFYELRDAAAQASHLLIDDLKTMAETELDHEQRLIKRFFMCATSFDEHQSRHLQILSEQLDRIDKISHKSELAAYLGYSHRHDYKSFWSGYVSLDDKNSEIQVLRLHQEGLCLPNRDYYLEENERMATIRSSYQGFFAKVGTKLDNLAPDNWPAVMKLETALAKASWTDVELRDIERSYNRFTLKDLAERFSSFDWPAYFEALGWQKPSDNVIVDQPDFIEAVLKLIDQTRLEDIKQYLAWHVVNRLLSWIDQESAELHFDFYGKVISGKKQNYPTWKRAVLQADSLIIGEIIGREYAKQYFPESSKQAVLEIVEDIRQAFHRRIDKLDWMSPTTKQRAHQKLDNIRVLIGYPSKWQDFRALDFVLDNHLANLLAARAFSAGVELAKVGTKPPSEDWQMHAHTVNAYHDPNQLVICFPAAILQPPFYEPSASYAANLGGIGAVIGHEFTHGFDDQGSQFDEKGNVAKWQSAAERAAFKKEAAKLVEQADRYAVLPSVHLQGELILGEALADVGGLTLACEALIAHNQPDDLKELFIGAAIAERGHDREEHAIRMAKTDPHPPSEFRINGVLPHVDAFYDVYSVKPGDKLYLEPSNRVKIW